ncbi:MAG: class I SAM-dependent methyltransferase [Phycisphaerales bacterium]
MDTTAPARAPPAPALARTLGDQLRRLLGLRRRIDAPGVRYRERTSEPLRRALSRKGEGAKEYEALFPDGGPPLRICATARRIYADLVGPRLLPVYRRAADWVTPGLRILLLEGGTGYAAEWVARQAGPSGAIVSLDRDEESTLFARRRYPYPNIAFETGGLESLSGETDGAFDAVFAVDALGPADDLTRALAELWRVVGEGGWLLAAVPIQPGSQTAQAEAARLSEAIRSATRPRPSGTETEPHDGDPSPPATAEDVRDGWATVIARRPRED